MEIFITILSQLNLMKYERLRYFKDIFREPAYHYISDKGLILQVRDVLQFHIADPDKDTAVSIKTVEEFLHNLEKFYNQIRGDTLKKGYSLCEEVLIHALKLLREPVLRRTTVSQRHLKKLSKKFLIGMSNLYKGIIEAFDPDELGKTNITIQQIIQYIFDDVIGLKTDFSFNKTGKYSFARRVHNLDKHELVVAIRLLTRPSGCQVRTFNGWMDLGLGHTPVRILGIKTLFRKKIYFLYKLSEHREYERQLRISPKQAEFHAL